MNEDLVRETEKEVLRLKTHILPKYTKKEHLMLVKIITNSIAHAELMSKQDDGMKLYKALMSLKAWV